MARENRGVMKNNLFLYLTEFFFLALLHLHFLSWR